MEAKKGGTTRELDMWAVGTRVREEMAMSTMSTMLPKRILDAEVCSYSYRRPMKRSLQITKQGQQNLVVVFWRCGGSGYWKTTPNEYSLLGPPSWKISAKVVFRGLGTLRSTPGSNNP